MQALAIAFRQRVHDGHEAGLTLVGGQLLFGIGGRIDQELGQGGVGDEAGLSAGLPAMLQCQIVSDLEQPPLQVRARPLETDVVEQREKHFLDDVLRCVAVEAERSDIANEIGAVGVEQDDDVILRVPVGRGRLGRAACHRSQGRIESGRSHGGSVREF